MTEAEFMQQIIDLAHLYSWHVVHFRPAWSKDGKRCMTAVSADGAGWPDLVLVKSNHLIFWEVKADKGRVSVEQLAWIERLSEVAFVGVVYPRDWSLIQEVLTRE